MHWAISGSDPPNPLFLEHSARYLVYQLVFEASETADVALALLSEVGFDSFEQKDEGQTLEAYWDLHQGTAPSEAEVRHRLGAFAPSELRVEGLEDLNWNQAWEAQFDPVEVGRFCRIRAEFHPSVPGFEHELLIQPKMSFGTGHHPTTHQVIALMQDLDFRGKRVLDMGSGTGVLGILAERLGAESVLAVDNDPWCESNARENAERNGCQRTQVVLGGIEAVEGRAFDIILANINRNVLIEQIPIYAHCARPAAQLLLSGFYPEDEAHLEPLAQQHGWQKRRSSERGGWMALHWSR